MMPYDFGRGAMSISPAGIAHAEHIDRVQREVKNVAGGCTIETLVGLCPDLTWNQIFLAIDYLSRSGKIRLTRGSGRDYCVQARQSKRAKGHGAEV
jgi:hypothetical protein